MAMTKEALTDLPVFDTRKYVRALTREGSFNEKQANANADGLQEALRGVATKADIKETKTETKAVKTELKAEIRRLEEKMDIQFQALRTETKAEIKEVKADIGALRTETKAEIKEVKADIRRLGREYGCTVSGVEDRDEGGDWGIEERDEGGESGDAGADKGVAAVDGDRIFCHGDNDGNINGGSGCGSEFVIRGCSLGRTPLHAIIRPPRARGVHPQADSQHGGAVLFSLP